MSYPVKPHKVYLIRTPRNTGTKTVKIELFQIEQFRQRWTLGNREIFNPAIPFRHNDRDIFWTSELYRVRVDGCWHTAGYQQYIFMTMLEIYNRWLK